MDKIIFAGDGHGAIVALQSLQEVFQCIEILSSDNDVVSLRRSTDIIISDFSEGKAQYAVLAGCKTMITPQLLQEKIYINTHPSLLPEYRGLHAVVWAMLNFEKEIGFSVHLVNEFMDDGDLLYQYKVLYNGQTSKQIMDEFDEFVRRDLGMIIMQFIKGEITPIKQDKTRATWVGKRNLDDCNIDFSWDNARLQMFFKALVAPYPRPRIRVKNKKYEVIQCEFVNRKQYYTHIGRVLNIDDQGVWIKTQDGFLVVKELFDVEDEVNISAKSILKLGMRLL